MIDIKITKPNNYSIRVRHETYILMKLMKTKVWNMSKNKKKVVSTN